MQKMSKKFYALFTLPTLIAFFIAFLLPFLFGIYLSFTKFTTVTNTQWVGFSNYIRAFTFDNNFVNALVFTVKFAIVSLILINLVAFTLALLLTSGVKGSNFFRTIFFMPNLIGGIVLGYIWQLIINGILINFGVDLTFDANYGFWGLVVLMNWQQAGYMMVIYIAAIQSIPTETIEAAKIDGANTWQLIKSITIPMVMPAITICTFLTLTNSFKLFDQNLALTAGAPGRQSAMLALDIYTTFYGRVGFEGVGQAKAVVFSLIVALIVILQMRLTRRKEVER